jgi:hypothetical protein
LQRAGQEVGRRQAEHEEQEKQDDGQGWFHGVSLFPVTASGFSGRPGSAR